MQQAVNVLLEKKLVYKHLTGGRLKDRMKAEMTIINTIITKRHLLYGHFQKIGESMIEIEASTLQC